MHDFKNLTDHDDSLGGTQDRPISLWMLLGAFLTGLSIWVGIWLMLSFS